MFFGIGVVLAFGAGTGVGQDAKPKTKADKLFDDKHYEEARVEYEKLCKAAPKTDEGLRAAGQAVTCRLRMQKFTEALDDAEGFLKLFGDSPHEAPWRRFLGGLYNQVPHWGTQQGDKFLRGQHGQGTYKDVFREDRRKGIAHMEQARLLFANWLTTPDLAAQIPEGRLGVYRQERLDNNFDLAEAYVGIVRYEGGWDRWLDIVELPPEDDAGTQGDADYESPRWMHNSSGYGNPQGLRMGEDGNPIFPKSPKEYAEDLPTHLRVRFLLEEVVRLDETDTRRNAAAAIYRRAMIERACFDSVRLMERSRQPRPGQEQVEPETGSLLPKNIWDLEDNQAVAWVEGELRTVSLPDDCSPVALLTEAVEKYPGATVAQEAQYAKAAFFQTRRQYVRAVREYNTLTQLFPQSYRIADARRQISVITEPKAMIEQLGVKVPGAKIAIPITYANTKSLQFKATRVDLAGFVLKGMRSSSQETFYQCRNIQYGFIRQELYKKYLKGVAAEWKSAVEDDGSHRTRTVEIPTPLDSNGAYIIEAWTDREHPPSLNLLLVTDIAILKKGLPGKSLFYVADAVTGHPIQNAEMSVFEHWNEYSDLLRKNRHKGRETKITSPENGLIPYLPKEKKQNPNIDAVIVLGDDRMAFSLVGYWWPRQAQSSFVNGQKYFLVTDRPVYRPKQNVYFKVFCRAKNEGAYIDQKFAGMTVNAEVYDPKGNKVLSQSLTLDARGGAGGSFELKEGCPLGLYSFRVNGYMPDGRWLGGGQFRVEEYKRPEFEVTVKPDSAQVKLGKEVIARIEARYYFGSPVSEGVAKYKVFRENYRPVYSEAGEYDWLYGQGYGRCYYPYYWLGWWGHYGHWAAAQDMDSWRCYRHGAQPKALRELVSAGEIALAKDGTALVKIDTGPALKVHPDADCRYTVEVEVRDPSRRTITGSGDILVTRQQFYAFLESDRGWYRPGDSAFIRARTITPDNAPVAAQGEFALRRITYGGADNREIREETLKEWAAETDAQGRCSVKLPFETSGQYRLTFKTKDAWGETVQGDTVMWVAGPDFDGAAYRFSNLEIITDKRTYRPGEMAHLMISSDAPDAVVLFSDNAQDGLLLNYRLIPVPKKSLVIDLEITKAHVPNFFCEATMIRGGNVYEEVREIYVPPTQGMLKVAASADGETYPPEGDCKLEVRAADADGRPVAADLLLTAYDKSLAYIQGSLVPDIRQFFWGERRLHNPEHGSSLEVYFTGQSFFRWAHYVGGVAGWDGMWMRGAGDWRMSTAGVGYAGNDKEDRGLMLNEAQEKPAQAGPMRAKLAAAPALEAKSEVSASEADAAAGTGGGAAGEPGGAPMAEAKVRSDFAETACWMPSLATDASGVAHVSFKFPQALTTWDIKAWAITPQTQVGSAETSVRTTKNLIVRLQSPRFFVERDEAVISANVHNYLATEKEVKAILELDGGLIEAVTPLNVSGKVDAGGQKRFDWPVRVLKSGLVKITVKALSDVESDAVQMSFPVLVHGVNKTVASSGSFRPAAEGERTIRLVVPDERDPVMTELVVTLSPSLAGVMLDALPYLIGYPYGCVEQTMSRFMPAVLCRQVLQRTGMNLEELESKRLQMNAGDLQNRFGYLNSPVFDSAKLNSVIEAGLARLYDFQHFDGGWGWWKDDRSCPFQTAYVVYGLHTARQAGAQVDGGSISRGMNYLAGSVWLELHKPESMRRLGDVTTQAYLAYVLSLEKRADEKWLAMLYEKRDLLNLYGKSLLALGMHNMGKAQEAQTLLRNIKQYAEQDKDNETAWFKTQENYWWFWWNNDIETNAWILQALATIEPDSDISPRLVKWLLNNRRNGYYWRSTRDTAYCIAAMAKFMEASGEFNPEATIRLELDGRQIHRIVVTRDNFFSFNNRAVLAGEALGGGEHVLKIVKEGPGALYYSSYLSFFTKEEDIKGAGNEIFVARRYFLLRDKVGTERVPGAQGKVVENRAGHERIELKNGDSVKSGDQIEVALTLTSKNDYDYLVFEDMKPAGCEPVELRSGGAWAGGLCPNVELRDEKVAFFIAMLEQGEHVLRYRLRAETPGRFHALPTSGYAMYAPEVKAISDEMRLGITDAE